MACFKDWDSIVPIKKRKVLESEVIEEEEILLNVWLSFHESEGATE